MLKRRRYFIAPTIACAIAVGYAALAWSLATMIDGPIYPTLLGGRRSLGLLFGFALVGACFVLPFDVVRRPTSQADGVRGSCWLIPATIGAVVLAATVWAVAASYPGWDFPQNHRAVAGWLLACAPSAAIVGYLTAYSVASAGWRRVQRRAR